MPRTATLEELFFRMTEGEPTARPAAPRPPPDAPAEATTPAEPAAGERMTAAAATAPRLTRTGRRPGVGTVYVWELRKLRAQKRTYLGLGAAAIVPLIFITALLTAGGGPDEVPFGRYVRETGLAIPLVGLIFSSVWLFPLITALVAGDIVASEDTHGTLKTILTRSTERWQIFVGKLLAALTYAFVALVVFVGDRARRRRADLGLRSAHDALGHAGRRRARHAADRRRVARVLPAADRDRGASRCCSRRSRTTRPARSSAR